MGAYRGDIKNIDYTDLNVLKPIADILEGYIGKHPDRPTYAIYPSLEMLKQKGAVLVYPVHPVYENEDQ